MLDTILNHKSIRKYQSKEVEPEILEEILTAGTRASTTGNMQVYSIVVNQKAETKEALAPLHFNQPAVKAAPVLITFCADYNRFNKWCLLNNAEPGYDNFLSFLNGAIDALLVAQNVCLAAEDKGLGICYFGTTLYNADKIIEVLNLPKGVVPITTITLGYPDEEPALTDRLPLEAVVHYESYNDYTDDKIVSLYAEKENLAENKQFVADNKKESLAQVFTDVRYKKADNEHFSEVVIQVLKKQGFMQ